MRPVVCGAFLALIAAGAPAGQGLRQEAGTWVKLSPQAEGPPSPRLGYEGACAWDSRNGVLIRYGGHNQGGGGEQHAEVWTFAPLTARWTLKEPNTSPPGICCGQQNLFDPDQGRYLRFPAFSGSHGWQWAREIYLNDSSLWSYDLEANTWRNMRPLPAPNPRPLRCASWDSEFGAAVLFGGEGSREGTLVYDPHANAWSRMEPSPQPEFRSGGNMAYDAARRLHVLFGSQFTDDPHTWTYDLRRNAWRDMRPASMPPTDRSDAVLAYDPRSRRVLAVVKLTEGKDENARHRLESWTYDAGRNAWSKLNPPREPDPTGNRARVLAAAPALDVLLLENRTHPPHGPPEQQVWSCRLPPAPDAGAGPLPPTELRAAGGAGHVSLTWRPSPSPGVTHLLLERAEGPHPWSAGRAVTRRLERAATAYRDADVKRGTLYHYRLRAAAAAPSGEDLLSGAAAARVQPRVVADGVVSVLSGRRVELTWTAAPEADVVGYHVERAAVEVLTEDQLPRLKSRTPPLAEPSVGAIRRIGAFERLTPAPVRGTSFRDTAVDLGRPRPVEGAPVYERTFSGEQLDLAGRPYRFAVHAYRVRAVSALGVESGPSPAWLTIPSSPQWLFAREDGTACRLKWAAGPERELRGYRVYRMDGRYDREPVTRLTPEPADGLAFTDPAAGAAARRYYVVAVDALGQEGFPSSPVWYNRQWKAFYLPFTGEWHQ